MFLLGRRRIAPGRSVSWPPEKASAGIFGSSSVVGPTSLAASSASPAALPSAAPSRRHGARRRSLLGLPPLAARAAPPFRHRRALPCGRRRVRQQHPLRQELQSFPRHSRPSRRRSQRPARREQQGVARTAKSSAADVPDLCFAAGAGGLLYLPPDLNRFAGVALALADHVGAAAAHEAARRLARDALGPDAANRRRLRGSDIAACLRSTCEDLCLRLGESLVVGAVGCAPAGAPI